MKKLLTTFLFAIFAAGIFGLFLGVAQAANIVDVNFPCPGGDIPGFPKCERIEDGVPTNDFVGYMLQAYQFGIGIVGIIAVGMIVYGGILIAWNTESIDKKGKGREMITSALTGIAVLFGSYLILNTINPELVKFNLTTNIQVQCSDGRDNDGDKKIDYPEDADCSSATDTTEALDKKALEEGLSALQNLCGENGDPAKISRNPELPGKISDNCEYRTMVYQGPEFKLGTDGDYYDELFDDTIKTNTKIWSYPYFIKEEGPKSAMCLIYAYKEGSSTITKIDLDNDLAICALNPKIKQKNGDTSTTESDSAARERLTKAGVQINKSSCKNVTTDTNCTSLEGMPNSAVLLLERLGNICKENSACSPVLTGGTEVAPHPKGSHGPNKAVFDLRSTGEKDDLIGTWLKNETSVKTICTSEAQKTFRKNCTTVEGNDHFHVEL
jgi:hypothetical protein